MEIITAFLLVLAMVVSCGHKADYGKSEPQFTDEVRLPTTPVKDQGDSPLCWIYGMLATIESEHGSMGDSVNLSVDYLARMFLREEGGRCWASRGQLAVSMRGMASMTLGLLRRYGAMPYDSYRARREVNYNVIERKMALMARSAPTLSKFLGGFDDLFDHAVDFLPTKVFMLGAQYSPLEFGHSVCRDDEYVALTSFSHHPFGRPFVLETADNQWNDEYLNVPIDTLMAVMETSISNGHAVCWEGDVSESGFSFADGIATLGSDEHPCTQQERQREFECGRITDDHVMALIGLAHDRQGRRYFIAKNSWGTENRFGGFMYLSFNYVRMKTIAAIVNLVRS